LFINCFTKEKKKKGPALSLGKKKGGKKKERRPALSLAN
jgi:hypothetical protein